jgi:hypothetical protein
MRHLRLAISVTAAAVLLTATAADAATGLTIVSSPNPAGSDFNELDGAVATAPTNAWAVGFTRASTALAFAPLAERWNGSAWRIVATAPVTADDNRPAERVVTRRDPTRASARDAAASGRARSGYRLHDQIRIAADRAVREEHGAKRLRPEQLGLVGVVR